MEFLQYEISYVTDGIISDTESMIGMAKDIKANLKMNLMKAIDQDDYDQIGMELAEEENGSGSFSLIKELDKYDCLVEVCYYPEGGWEIFKLTREE